jgi:DNA-binding NarL/FixJ family response regulator
MSCKFEAPEIHVVALSSDQGFLTLLRMSINGQRNMLLTMASRKEGVSSAIHGVDAHIVFLDLDALPVVTVGVVSEAIDYSLASQTRTVVVSSGTESDEVLVGISLSRGFGGLVGKSSSATVLLESIRAAASGGVMVCPSIARRLVSKLVHPARDSLASTVLSRRENEVAELVSTGLTNAEISALLIISVDTVKKHVHSIRGKLGFRNRVQIAVWVMESRVSWRASCGIGRSAANIGVRSR